MLRYVLTMLDRGRNTIQKRKQDTSTMKVTYVNKKEAARVELESEEDAIKFQRTVHASSGTVKLRKDGYRVKTQRTGRVVMLDMDMPGKTVAKLRRAK